MCMHPQSYIHISLSHTLHTYMCFTFTIQVYVDRGPSFLRVNFWAVLIVTYLDKHTQTHWMHLSRQGRESFIFPFIIILCYLKDKILYQPRLASNSWSSVYAFSHSFLNKCQSQLINFTLPNIHTHLSCSIYCCSLFTLEDLFCVYQSDSEEPRKGVSFNRFSFFPALLGRIRIVITQFTCRRGLT